MSISGSARRVEEGSAAQETYPLTFARFCQMNGQFYSLLGALISKMTGRRGSKVGIQPDGDIYDCQPVSLRKAGMKTLSIVCAGFWMWIPAHILDTFLADEPRKLSKRFIITSYLAMVTTLLANLVLAYSKHESILGAILPKFPGDTGFLLRGFMVFVVLFETAGYGILIVGVVILFYIDRLKQFLDNECSRIKVDAGFQQGEMVKLFFIHWTINFMSLPLFGMICMYYVMDQPDSEFRRDLIGTKFILAKFTNILFTMCCLLLATITSILVPIANSFIIRITNQHIKMSYKQCKDKFSLSDQDFANIKILYKDLIGCAVNTNSLVRGYKERMVYHPLIITQLKCLSSATWTAAWVIFAREGEWHPNFFVFCMCYRLFVFIIHIVCTYSSCKDPGPLLLEIDADLRGLTENDKDGTRNVDQNDYTKLEVLHDTLFGKYDQCHFELAPGQKTTKQFLIFMIIQYVSMVLIIIQVIEFDAFKIYKNMV